jgi:hypothetical protein
MGGGSDEAPDLREQGLDLDPPDDRPVRSRRS